jgi:hypothetical protein
MHQLNATDNRKERTSLQAGRSRIANLLLWLSLLETSVAQAHPKLKAHDRIGNTMGGALVTRGLATASAMVLSLEATQYQ